MVFRQRMYKQAGPIWRWSASQRTEISVEEEVWPATVVRKRSGGGGHGGWKERERKRWCLWFHCWRIILTKNKNHIVDMDFYLFVRKCWCGYYHIDYHLKLWAFGYMNFGPFLKSLLTILCDLIILWIYCLFFDILEIVLHMWPLDPLGMILLTLRCLLDILTQIVVEPFNFCNLWNSV